MSDPSEFVDSASAATKSIFVFRTLPDHRNSNTHIEGAFSSALRRVAPSLRVVRSPIEIAADALLVAKPSLIIGIGSVLPDDIDYTAITRAARRLNAPVIYWLHDDPYEFDFNWKIDGQCDWIFTTDRSSMDYYRTPNVSHLPLAASKDLHFRDPIPIRERTIDVFFCGVGYPNRRSIITKLRNVLHPCQTVITGDNWNEKLPFCQNRRMSPAEIIDGYSSSRIVLNIGRQFNLANRQFDIVASTPGPRTFEAAAAGCVQAAFFESCELLEYFARDTEILTFSSISEFSHIIDRARYEPDTLDPIAAAAQVRVLTQHTYDHRAGEMLAVLRNAGLLSFPM
jgi:spore maturation protein CgeB